VVTGEIAVETGQRGRQVEAEAVDADAFGPVAQGIHREGDDMRVGEVERIAASGGVVQATDLLLVAPVVGEVVETPPADGGAFRTGFAGVVVDHVHDHFEARFVQCAHHVDDLFANGGRSRLLRGPSGVRGLRGEVSQCGIAPIIGTAAFLQEQFRLLGLNRHQSDGGHAQILQIGERRGVG